MANAYYNHGSIPADNSQGSSAEIRAEFDSVTAGFAKLPTLTGNGSELVVVNAGETALETQSASTLVAAQIHGATAKATPADADELPMADSAASYALKNFTFANLWTWIQAKLNGATAKTTPTGADTLPLSDSAAAGATKTLSITNLVTYLSGLCSAGWNAATATAATTAASCSGSAASAGSSGTFTAGKVGYFNAAGINCSYSINNGWVSLNISGQSGSSDGTTYEITGLPAEITPTGDRILPIFEATNNGSYVYAYAYIESATSKIHLFNGHAGGAWSATGTKGCGGINVTYSL